MSNEVKKDLLERSVIYHVSTLTDFQKKVNSAAASVAIREPVLVWKGNWGTLLEKAREQVSVELFAFKKESHAQKCMVKVEMKNALQKKRIKLSEEISTQRISELREDIEGIECHLAFKEKHLKQSEASRQYSVCDRFLYEIRDLKGVKREKSRELVQKRSVQRGTVVAKVDLQLLCKLCLTTIISFPFMCACLPIICPKTH